MEIVEYQKNLVTILMEALFPRKKAVAVHPNCYYYQLLGVDKKATMAELKKAYHGKALKYHPDKRRNGVDDGQFERICIAYKVLSDRKKRRMFDCCGEDGLRVLDQLEELKDVSLVIRGLKVVLHFLLRYT